MTRNTYKVVFDDYSELSITAFNAIEASILAQAKRIEAGKPYAVRFVEVAYGAYDARKAAPHLEVVR